MSIKPVFQHDEPDCGVCCVAMLYFCDPALGNTRLTVTDFLELWSGIFFVTLPGLNFEKTNDEQNVLIKYFALLKPYKSSLIKILTSSFILREIQEIYSFLDSRPEYRWIPSKSDFEYWNKEDIGQ